MWKKKQVAAKPSTSTNQEDMEGPKMDFKSILKEMEFIVTPHMTWKERKALENRRIVSLGGKPVKNQRLPLSVARVQMKKQKEREEKQLQESMVLGRFGGGYLSNVGIKKQTEKRRAEDRVLKSTGGHFRNGVLDVKHMLRSNNSSKSSSSTNRAGDAGKNFLSKGEKKKGGGGGNKSHGKNKKGGKKRH